MIYVIDSSALIAFLWKEQGGLLVKDLISNFNNNCFIHALNLCDVYYDFIRRTEVNKADEVIEKVFNFLTVRYDLLYIYNHIDIDFFKQAGKYKAELKRISLADCFCLTLGKKIGGTLVTADHHEFDKINTLNIVPLLFIR